MNSSDKTIALANTKVTGLSTNAFIKQTIEGRSIVTAGNDITVYKTVKKKMAVIETIS
jgi:hypothetical protein